MTLPFVRADGRDPVIGYILERLNKLEVNNYIPEENLVHVLLETTGVAVVNVDVYYVKTQSTMTVCIMPFTFTATMKGYINIEIPDIQIPISTINYGFLYLIMDSSGSYHTGKIKLDASNGTCLLVFTEETNGGSFATGSVMNLPYRVSISYVIC